MGWVFGVLLFGLSFNFLVAPMTLLMPIYVMGSIIGRLWAIPQNRIYQGVWIGTTVCFWAILVHGVHIKAFHPIRAHLYFPLVLFDYFMAKRGLYPYVSKHMVNAVVVGFPWAILAFAGYQFWSRLKSKERAPSSLSSKKLALELREIFVHFPIRVFCGSEWNKNLNGEYSNVFLPFRFFYLAFFYCYLLAASPQIYHSLRLDLWLALPFVLAFGYAVYISLSRAPTYVNDGGYTVLRDGGQLEHRYVAEQVLNRTLTKNEIVHHINGLRSDNRVENLCVMDWRKHEHFHAWLKWKKDKTGKYPRYWTQKRVLETEYAGTLLESVVHTASASSRALWQ